MKFNVLYIVYRLLVVFFVIVILSYLFSVVSPSSLVSEDVPLLEDKELLKMIEIEENKL